MNKYLSLHTLLGLFTMLWLLIGCSGSGNVEETAVSNPISSGMLTLPDLAAANLDGEPLNVIASTSLIGDVVAQVGGEAIVLTTLMSAGQDPHSYEPGAQALTAVAQADVIFVNGWDLEESVVQDLEAIGDDVPLIPISANIQPLLIDSDPSENGPGGADPHVWLDIQNVVQWTENVAQVLADLDPANAAAYEGNAQAYLTRLTELETYLNAQVATIPQENRLLVTNHDSFSYFAEAYGFEILDTVIPGNSSLAEPSANDLVTLINTMKEHDVCTIFTETTVNDSLVQTVATELSDCHEVQVVTLYSGAVGLPGSGADSYIGMIRANIDVIVAGLK